MPEGEVEIWLRARVDRLTQDIKKSAEAGGSVFAMGIAKLAPKMISKFTGISAAGGMGGLAMSMMDKVISIISGILDSINKMYDELKKASPTWKGMQDTLEKMNNLVMKPIGDVFSMLLRPYLMLMMRRLRTGLRAAGEVFKKVRGGEMTMEEASEEIGDIVMGMLADFGKIQWNIRQTLQPLAAEMQGFIDGVKHVADNWTAQLESLDEYIGGWAAGIGAAAGEMSIELFEAMTELALEDTDMFKALGKTIKDEYQKKASDPNTLQEWKDLGGSIIGDWLLEVGAEGNASLWKDLPKDTKGFIIGWLEDADWTPIASLPGDLRNKIIDEMFPGAGAIGTALEEAAPFVGGVAGFGLTAAAMAMKSLGGGTV